MIPYLTEADSPGIGGYPLVWATPDTTPSIYPRRECKELPAWLAFDKQVILLIILLIFLNCKLFYSNLNSCFTLPLGNLYYNYYT